MKLKKGELQTQVEYCLHKYPDTRNSDVELTTRIWREFYSSYLITRPSTKQLCVALVSLFEIPREDNVKRIRAKFQNDLGLYLPTSPIVARQRRINEEKWLDYMRNFNN